jgi:hypothetical protein
MESHMMMRMRLHPPKPEYCQQLTTGILKTLGEQAQIRKSRTNKLIYHEATIRIHYSNDMA